MTANLGDYGPSLTAAADFIRQKDDFLVVAHVNPDGDAISSTLAVAEILRQLGKRYILINDGAVPAKFSFLMGNEVILNGSENPQLLFKNVISVDCADYRRIGDVRFRFVEGTPLLNIDHHPTNDGFGIVNLVRPDAAATAEVLYDLAAVIGTEWTLQLATLVYAGLSTDTGGFRYANTTPAVMKIASEMLALGVKGNEIADRLLEKLTLTQIRLLQKALAKLSVSSDGKIAWISLTHDVITETGASNDDMDGLVNYPRNIEGVEVGILFKEFAPGQFKASLRSAGLVDVASIAQIFGGGGHIRAAGCSLEGPVQDVTHRVIEAVEKSLSVRGIAGDSTR
ncbi:DHH family phosphoesterase [Gorillibacterium massiliense]|uniref:DHH family phosphoesterase n=1 Tax=Gorillibacterium massiliense TaxID=1280390 RepID=UPI0004B4EBD3|nr:bifunctional oligoribonuclease/PAP phosphatase NrnA [Gorillibacterium massiliense]